jgi:hypothetical protein
MNPAFQFFEIQESCKSLMALCRDGEILSNLGREPREGHYLLQFGALEVHVLYWKPASVNCKESRTEVISVLPLHGTATAVLLVLMGSFPSGCDSHQHSLAHGHTCPI